MTAQSRLLAAAVLADPLLARVHQRGDLFRVRAPLRVGDAGCLGGPRGDRDRGEGASTAADPRVDDGADVAGAGQVALADRVGEDPAVVKAASSTARSVCHSHFAW